MATPYGHSLAGTIVYLVFNKAKIKDNWKIAGLYIIAANLADFDFIPGILIGYPDKFHHGISHSLGFSVIFAASVFLLGWLKNKKNKLKLSFICFSLYFSHVIIDWLTFDTGYPYGEPFWWPFSGEYYMSPLSILPEIRRHDLLNLTNIIHDIKAVFIETLLFLPVVFLIYRIRRKRA